MEFGIEKYAMVIMKSRKRQTVEGIKLPHQECIRKISKKENYKNFVILELSRDERKKKKKTP